MFPQSEVTRNQNKLEKEITETQAAQIELDRTAEEFKNQHEQRGQLFNRWDQAQKNVEQRNRALEEETEKFKLIHQQTITVKTNLENEKEKLEGMIKENKDFEGEIRLKDKQIVKLRTHLKLLRAKRRDLEGNVEITKNRLSAESTLL